MWRKFQAWRCLSGPYLYCGITGHNPTFSVWTVITRAEPSRKSGKSHSHLKKYLSVIIKVTSYVKIWRERASIKMVCAEFSVCEKVAKQQNDRKTPGGFKGVIFGWCDHGQFSPFLFPTYLYFFERQ